MTSSHSIINMERKSNLVNKIKILHLNTLRNYITLYHSIINMKTKKNADKMSHCS